MRKASLLSLLLLVSGCVSNEPAQKPGISFDVKENIRLIEDGYRLLPKNAKEAREEYFGLIIENCAIAFDQSEVRYYYARTPAESLYYLLKARVDEQQAEILDVPCAEAHYLSAYASIDLGRVSDAESDLKSALRWSPVNPQYLSELAHLKQVQRAWNESLKLFSEAEDNTKAYSPNEVQESELVRAKRGVGYALIELGRLEEAKAKFRECLEINPEDEKAKHELTYIDELTAGTR